MQTSMTALISLFSRAYHTKRSVCPVFSDTIAEKLLSAQEYETAASSMKSGRSFFLPDFDGSDDSALDIIVNTVLAPPVVARSAFCLDAFNCAQKRGIKQLVLLGSGYDSLPYREGFDKTVRTFEFDRQEMTDDKRFRLERAKLDFSHVSFVPCDLAADFETPLLSAGFGKSESTFCSMLGLCHYLSRDEFSALLKKLGGLFAEGSDLVFDFPLKTQDTEPNTTETLASGAGESMKARYSFGELESVLSKSGFRIYEYLEKEDIERRFFDRHNFFTDGTGRISASGDFALCLAAKKE